MKSFLSFLAVTALGTTQAAVLLGVDEGFTVVAAKDASLFRRDPSGDRPDALELALVGENLMGIAGGNITFDRDEEVEFLDVFWSVNNGEETFVQEPFETNGTFVVFTAEVLNAAGDIISPDFLSVTERGFPTLTLTMSLNEDFSDSVEATFELYTITNLESVTPLVMLIVLSLLSRNVYVAMFFGIWIGSLIIEAGDIPLSFKELFIRHMLPSVTGDIFTITFTLFLGGFISMVKRAGGQDGFSDFIGKYATSPRKTQLATVACGVGLFFDDYSSVLILGSSFKKLTDRFYVSREKLAFVADSTSAPIASISPISSWIAFEISRIEPELENIVTFSAFQEEAAQLPGAYPFFLNTIPSRYYPIFMLVIQVTLILAGVEFGPMLFAERKTRLGKRQDGGDGAMEVPVEMDRTNPEDDTPRKAWNFFIPIGFFIASLVVSLINIGTESIEAQNIVLIADGDEPIPLTARDIFGNTDSFAALIFTTMGASLFALVFYTIQFKKDGQIVIPTIKEAFSIIDCRLQSAEDLAAQEGVAGAKATGARPIMWFTEGVNCWVEGFKNLVPAILILCMAFTIKSIVVGCATDRFFTDLILNSDLPAGALPTIIFLVAALLSLSTGTSFGTMSIMFPLVSFATFEKSQGDEQLFTIALSSIMAGAIFGDHSSLISDTTILASIGSGCSIGAHVYTQMPYALWGALFGILFGTLPAGFGASVPAMLVIGGIALAAATIFVSAPIVAESGRLDMFSELLLMCTKNKKLEQFKIDTRDFAAENPQMIDMEPMAFFKACFTGQLFKGSAPKYAEEVVVAEGATVKKLEDTKEAEEATEVVEVEVKAPETVEEKPKEAAKPEAEADRAPAPDKTAEDPTTKAEDNV